MAKNNSNPPAISKASLKSFIVSADEVSREGEVFAGKNVLKLAPGQAAAGLVIAKIGTQIVKGRGKEKGKTREIPAYTATAPDGNDYGLPLNRSFIDKASDAKLAVGDTVTVVCEGEYVSKDGNRGVGYALIVTGRKGKK
jgi:hypothetical protein